PSPTTKESISSSKLVNYSSSNTTPAVPASITLEENAAPSDDAASAQSQDIKVVQDPQPEPGATPTTINRQRIIMPVTLKQCFDAGLNSAWPLVLNHTELS
ncbi:hypothetical protein EJB05_14483, partial [Eragrostis curvula]